MKRIMFVCKHNSRRSHMAEGFARQLGGNQVQVESAGLEASQVDPLTIQVMSEASIDISQQTSQALSEFNPEDFEVVISLCGCGVNLPPEWLSRDVFQDWQLEDPAGSTIETFRLIRDQVQQRVITLLNDIDATAKS
ncbi:MAG: arsenate reductase, glutathione/glutaredoxin type [Cyanobacteria bacterium P01_F01_bin.42]